MRFGGHAVGNARPMDPDTDLRFSPHDNRAGEIAWRPWGEPAFEEARRLGRPVLLSLSAVWCHWCHVMDETSYSDPDVIAAVNAQYVPVRVDNDRHPDVNRRYNMGGWPTTAFLTPGGDIITGATYVPPGQLRQALDRVREFFDSNKATLQHVERPELEEPGDEQHEHDDAALARIPDELAVAAVRAFDPVYGGVGSEPKFPQADVFAFLLAYATLRPEAPDAPRALEMLAKTLEAMARGGMYDHGGGGFYRYATRRDWSEPHYEKMLEDEARLALLYLDAFGLARAGVAGLGEPRLHRDAAAGALAHITGTLWLGDPPAFGGSQDADEAYYELDAEGREALPSPSVDATVYVDWNALAARALLRGAALLGRPELAGRALATLGFIWETARRDELLAHFVTPSGRVSPGSPLLADQAGMAAALLDAYETVAERRWLERAQELVAAAERFSAADGRLDDRLPQESDSPGLLAQPVPALDDNALLADVLLRLTAHTGDESYRDRALHVLAAWVPFYERYGVGAAPYGAALLRAAEHPEHIAVVGGRDDDAARRLHGAALAAPRPLRTVQLLDPADATDARHIAAAGLGGRPQPAAYVCRGRSCQSPTEDPASLAHPAGR
jgi:uncharacterized protein YyaL (SSP411 family)